MLVAAVLVLLVPRRERSLPLEIVHVGARADGIAVARGPDANLAEFLLDSAELSVHLHFMGRGQLCPLHVHPHGTEASTLVRGRAEVTTVTPEARHVAMLGPGSTAIFGPGVAHRFLDTSKEAPIVSLVVSSPRFEHNTYVLDEADPRIHDGAAQTTDFAEAIAAFERTSEPLRRVDLGGGLALLLVRDAMELAPGVSAPTAIAYVLHGEGTADGRPIAREDLAIARVRVTLRATKPLALLAVTAR